MDDALHEIAKQLQSANMRSCRLAMPRVGESCSRRAVRNAPCASNSLGRENGFCVVDSFLSEFFCFACTANAWPACVTGY
jgi:hypothetical protein